MKGWRLAGEIARAERDWDTAEGHFRKSLDFAVSLGNPVQHWKAEIALGQFLHDAKRVDEAQQAFDRALAVMQRVREGLRDDRLRDAFDRNPDLRWCRASSLPCETRPTRWRRDGTIGPAPDPGYDRMSGCRAAVVRTKNRIVTVPARPMPSTAS